MTGLFSEVVANGNKRSILDRQITEAEPRVTETFEQRRVRLVRLINGAERHKPFRRLAHESQSAMRHRLYEHEGVRDCAFGKAAAYERALSFGAIFPPVFIFNLKGNLILHDGWYRCAAAALRGHDHISAVVFQVCSAGEGERLADLLFELQSHGEHWRECVRSAGAFLRACRDMDEATASQS